jgi:hypothetical protein
LGRGWRTTRWIRLLRFDACRRIFVVPQILAGAGQLRIRPDRSGAVPAEFPTELDVRRFDGRYWQSLSVTYRMAAATPEHRRSGPLSGTGRDSRLRARHAAYRDSGGNGRGNNDPASRRTDPSLGSETSPGRRAAYPSENSAMRVGPLDRGREGHGSVVREGPWR